TTTLSSRSSTKKQLRKCPLGIKIHLVAHDIETSARQFVGNGFASDHAHRLSLLAIEELPHPLAVAPGVLGRLDIGPGQVLVPVLAVAFAFLLGVAQLATAHTPTVRSVMPHTLDALHLSGFQ